MNLNGGEFHALSNVEYLYGFESFESREDHYGKSGVRWLLPAADLGDASNRTEGMVIGPTLGGSTPMRRIREQHLTRVVGSKQSDHRRFDHRELL